MSQTLPDSVAIRPFSKRNGITLSVAGGLSFVISIMLFIFVKGAFAVALLLFALGIVGTVLGFTKLKEPPVSVLLAKQGLAIFHRRGEVAIDWSNIQRIDQLRVNQNMQMVDLPYIGLKLKKLSPIIDTISPRLATGLLTEQRPLLMTAATHDGDLQSLEHYLSAEFTPLAIENKDYQGVQAMFGHRCLTLNENLGYHLYIPVDMLDRSEAEFVTLVRNWKQAVEQ
ncbi:DUF2982 domain-containing protein [Shewanella sp. WXL01]|uniref:DUF2982 domain-containing protein n=1 Tax=Shewanella maritima TaxID=2520507 RepID=A0A411PN98_9GAMM|nr:MULTISPECIES: DUF2982 domain-containing protein [Shewanella]NKF51681.1 DUF2982 domain-containing protein [Shewanella sp. WXL01]QBF84961.1 DUF2982 domain-containing protein [Shewanella maritima]